MSTTRLVEGLFIASLLLSGVGCSHTRAIGTGSPEVYDQITEHAAGHTVEVVLRDGARHRAQALHMRTDSASWFDPDENDVMSVATTDIAEIRNVVNHGRGALHGLGLGALIGGLAGAALGAGSCEGAFGAGTCAMLGGSVFGGAGLVVGGVVGGAVGSKGTYRFQGNEIVEAESRPPAADRLEDCSDQEPFISEEGGFSLPQPSGTP